MGSFTNKLEDWLLDHIVGKTSYPMPTCYVALWIGDPLDTGAGGAEVSGVDYARAATVGDDWNASSAGSISNANDITFPKAGGDWGTVDYFALMDDSADGNMLAHGSLASSKHIESDEIAKFAGGTPGDLVLTLD